jgi:hypothetical protein
LIGAEVIRALSQKMTSARKGRTEGLAASREVVFVPGDVVITCGQPRLLNFADPFGTDAD